VIHGGYGHRSHLGWLYFDIFRVRNRDNILTYELENDPLLRMVTSPSDHSKVWAFDCHRFSCTEELVNRFRFEG